MLEGIDLKEELARTQPDFVVFVPDRFEGEDMNTGNEHFLVFVGPDRAHMAVWTQSTFEGQPDQRIVFSRENDDGTWTRPVQVAGKPPGADPKSPAGMASWGFPMVSKSGRIYVLFNRHIGVNDIFSHTTGLMCGVYSDDAGRTWSEAQTIPMPRTKWDNPDPDVPANWIVWQKPLRLSEGKYLAGFTRWISPAVRPPTPINVWWANGSVVEFMRFENLDDDPEPADLEISYFATDEDALQAPLIDHPEHSVIQEPSLVRLPDGRLFCVMRTTQGCPYYAVSDDEGRTWTKPEPLLQTDDGPRLLHPCSPCPMYDIDGRYVFFHHNHDGHFEQWGPKDTTWHRRPIYVRVGEFRPGARQPVWFSEPRFMMDNAGVPLGYGKGRTDLALYASHTVHAGEHVLWYPERKFFLLGRKLDNALLGGLSAPESSV